MAMLIRFLNLLRVHCFSAAKSKRHSYDEVHNFDLSPLYKSHHDRETTISLEKSGLFFFISGAEEHCQKGQTLEVMVLSDKHGSSHISTVQAPSPHHHCHNYHAPVPAPTNGGTGLKAGVGFICGTTAVGSLVSL
ncbi:early nodulin-like protein 1 [Olea europaea var. sylvestris]|uniref:early nodulin-like protein 1 n=1 Tax=Olea europaea var. sylvestris TaxID=158386 RepID=UPI000C1D79F2|nr:early nodulin-like protein 1 [Olea europaea var. sylvestris]